MAQVAAGSGAPPALVADLGSGGGIPGLILAAEWASSAFVLIEAATRRSIFLREAIRELGWTSRVDVDSRRAELVGRDPSRRGRFDLVTARSFAAPPVTAECASPLLRPGGVLVVAEPPRADDPGDRWPSTGLGELGLVAEEGSNSSSYTFSYTFKRLRQAAPCPDRYPRRVGVPQKRPIF